MRKVCFAVVFAAACGQPQQTIQVLDQVSQLDIELTTDLDVPKDLDSMSVTFGPYSGPRLFELGPTGRVLPTLIASEGILFSTNEIGRPAEKTMDVTVVAWKGAAPFTVTRAVVAIPFQPGDRIVRMSLSWLCAGTAREVAPGQFESTCPAGESCRAGQCRSDDRTAELLATSDSSSPACFDVAKCVAAGSPIAVDLATCTAPRGAATNFAVVKPAGTEGFCTADSCVAPLSAGPFEGWRGSAGNVVFPGAVCSALADGRATAILASTACPTWSTDQRFCGTAP